MRSRYQRKIIDKLAAAAVTYCIYSFNNNCQNSYRLFDIVSIGWNCNEMLDAMTGDTMTAIVLSKDLLEQYQLVGIIAHVTIGKHPLV